MCYPKPGPRCTSHLNQQMVKAMKKLKDAEDSGDAKAAADASEEVFQLNKEARLTPQYIKALKENGQSDVAIHYENERNKRIFLSKVKTSLSDPNKKAPESYKVISKDGKRVTYEDGKGRLHRKNGPASISEDGSKAYLQHGVTHRTDGPAITKADGRKEYLVKGVHHRTDGPAIIKADGSKEYRVNGKTHRTDGPAIETADGHKIWVQDSVITRLDGPAIEEPNGKKSFIIDGNEYADESAYWAEAKRLTSA